MDKINPSVPIMLDKERHLLLDLNAMVAFEESTGKSLLNPETSKLLNQNMTAKDLRALLWSCLIHEDDKLTIKQVGSWINTSNMSEIAERIGAAFALAMPEGDKKQAPLVKRRPAG